MSKIDKLIKNSDLPQICDVKPSVLNVYVSKNDMEGMPVVNFDLQSFLHGAKELPFESNKFTVIRAIDVSHELSQVDLQKLISELRRVLYVYGELHIGVRTSYKDRKELYSTLISAGFSEVTTRPHTEDLALLLGSNTANDYELLIAKNSRVPHEHDEVLGEKVFQGKCAAFVETHKNNPPSTYIIAIYNEAKNLPHFLSFLENAENRTLTKREFVFVLNGCTDNSEEIINNFTKSTNLQTKVIISGMGIVTAYIAGINAKSLNGFIGKIDGDVFLHPHILDLMQMHLFENETVQVTYAEPMPSDSQCSFNESDHVPGIMSKRLYYTSKTSLNRYDPFGHDEVKKILQGFRAEDMFLSFYFAYFYGVNSISRTPHGCVYAKTVQNYDDLVRQISRANSEMKREFQAYPPFKAILGVMEQELYPSNYFELFMRAKADSTYVDEWTRIESTK